MKCRTRTYMSVVSVFLPLILCVIAVSAQAQNFTVIHNFTGGQDGAGPLGIAMDRNGNIYGATGLGGTSNGVIYKLKRSGSNWLLFPLYTFAGGSDGTGPAGVTIAPDGSLYGTTGNGGQGCAPVGCGTVFHLRPAARATAAALSPWTETVIYRFTGGSDGLGPNGDLVFDSSGNLYGTTSQGGNIGGICSEFGDAGCGVVFELLPQNGGWAFSNLYSFTGINTDGSHPYSGVIFDTAGRLYGTTIWGGTGTNCFAGCGTVYKLTPSGSGMWSPSTLYNFQNGSDGRGPQGVFLMDGLGNLYGPAGQGGAGNGGTVYQLAPSGGGWTFNLLTSLVGTGGAGPSAGLSMDTSGDLYGTTYSDSGHGTVFKLHHNADGSWTYILLHGFTGGSDGAFPAAKLIVDSQGNVFGTAQCGGTGTQCALGCGVVFEITP